MQDFFQEFEDYVRKTYGEKHFFKTLLEDSIRPLKDSMENITKEDVLESLFGDLDLSNLEDALSNINFDGLGGGGRSKKESGLSKKSVDVNIKSINKSILKSIGGSGDGISKKNSAAGLAMGAGAGLGMAGLGIGAGLGLGALGLGAALDDPESIKKLAESLNTLLMVGAGFSPGELFARSSAVAGALAELGVGLAVFSVGQGATMLMNWMSMGKNWTKEISDDVYDLLLIGEGFEGTMGIRALEVFSALTLLGSGLAIFSLGQGATAVANWISNGDWVNKVADDVSMLLAIGESVDGSVEAAADFTTTMAFLGAGLFIFSLGQGANAISSWPSQGDWATKISEDVKILLSIPDTQEGIGETFKRAGTFIGVMTLLGTGLTIFAVGKLANAIGEWVSRDDWAKKVKEDVGILMSIATDYGSNMDNLEASSVVVRTLAFLAAGLGVFAFGKGAEAIASWMGGRDQAKRIVTDVTMLMSLGAYADTENGENFVNVMTDISKGLAILAGGNLASSLSNIGSSIIGFFTGTESPMESMLTLAKNADKLMLGAEAIERMGNSLNQFGKAIATNSADKFDFKQMAENLGDAIPFLDALYNGGEVEVFGINPDFGKGLKAMKGDIDGMAELIGKVNVVLGRSTSIDPSLMSPKSQSESRNTDIKESEEQYRARRREEMEELRELLGDVAGLIVAATADGSAGIINAINTRPNGGDVINNYNTYTTPDSPTQALRKNGATHVRGK